MMRDLTAGRDCVRVPGPTVADLIDELERAYPGVKERLVVRGQLAPGLMVTVDGRRALRVLEETVGGESEVRFLPLMAGG
jgi:molybdopterin converting factor small subunit